jgi:hypothetical protein
MHSMMNNATSNRRRQAVENSIKAGELRAAVSEAYVSARVGGCSERESREHADNVRILWAFDNQPAVEKRVPAWMNRPFGMNRL